MPLSFHSARTSWQWMGSALDAAGDGILIECGERVLYANDAYAKLLGYRRPADLIQRTVATIIAAQDADRLTRFGRMRAAGEHPPSSYDFAARCADCTSVRLQASVSMSVYAGKPYIMTIVRPFARDDHSASSAVIAGPHDTLSVREHQIMEQILAGRRPKTIAWDLGVSEKTVATYRARLLAKLGVADNRELFQYALRHGLVDWT